MSGLVSSQFTAITYSLAGLKKEQTLTANFFDYCRLHLELNAGIELRDWLICCPYTSRKTSASV
jgi:hypothetical protein